MRKSKCLMRCRDIVPFQVPLLSSTDRGGDRASSRLSRLQQSAKKARNKKRSRALGP